MVVSSKRIIAATNDYWKQLRLQWGNKKPIDFPVNISIMSKGAWFSHNKRLPDASNLYEFPQDLLQTAGVLKDDRLIETHDGSKRICLCDDCRYVQDGKRKCVGVMKCPREEIEILLKEL